VSVPIRYARATDVREALEFLREYGPETAVLAGGTDLMIDLRAGNLRVSRLLDISRIPEIKGVEQRHGDLQVGAGLTFSEIMASDLVRGFAPLLARAASTIGSRQIRNVATLGGNVAHCSPCADSVPALLVHETRVVLANAHGERTISLEAFLKGPYRTDRRPNELITRFILKGWDGGFHVFRKLTRRRELAVARLTLAVLADTDADSRISVLRLAVGAGTPAPQRMAMVEGFLMGKRLAEGDLWEGGRLLAQEMVGVSGTRPSTVYKEKAVQGLLVRALFPLISVPSAGGRGEGAEDAGLAT
jgi:CO/xanthine dehydrogenase FAD-binding subunit